MCPLPELVGSCCGAGVEDAVAVMVRLGVLLGVRLPVGGAVAVLVCEAGVVLVGVRVGVGLDVLADVGIGLDVPVCVAVRVLVGVRVCVAVRVRVGVRVSVIVGVRVGVFVGPGVTSSNRWPKISG